MPTVGSKLPDLPNNDQSCMIVSSIPVVDESQDKINFGHYNILY
jgi:hypothetical protein